MKKYSQSLILKTGLAIFAMLFGSANLIFPMKIGVISGDKTAIGLIGFILSGILIPMAGLMSMVFFNGDYRAFFYRIGKVPGNILIALCMLIIGPLVAMPRIITFSYEIVRPFVGNHLSLLLFSTIFSIITFIFTYKKNSLLDSIGKILSPLLLLSLSGIFSIGYWLKDGTIKTVLPDWQVFSKSFLIGYNTLDLLGTIFFASIVISILYSTLEKDQTKNPKYMAKIMSISSLIAGVLLALVYCGIAYLGAWHGKEFAALDEGKIFINTILKIVGSQGALVLAATVFLACLTTIIALTSVVSEYLKNGITKNRLSYINCLIIILVTATFMSQFELGPLLKFSAPLISIAYPVLITLTFCNLAYKLWGFKPVKIPVLITLIISSYFYGPKFINILKESKNLIEKV
ncbi:branched-chain amino acid transport system II carrier protein [Candidatus Babela massiliensis]|uniref:Branched-chain amino acid permease n=1 Tax=Candidatus Babela massiliensis TaxID=673862 RepID=V6DFX0_9BACT|nr:branched-chain amino acid transport system II carrier protein [Candidatus Babela massiliensis]CDK30472.1 Branched-chain amino acid permease [Candidatus Babela massiliensis]